MERRPISRFVRSVEWLPGVLLILTVVLVYLPVTNAGFIWDDDFILTANPAIVGPLGFADIWTGIMQEPLFAPLVRSTLWLEHALWGLNPAPYHVVNVLFHAASAILLWRVLLALRIPGAWFGAALWSLHPVNVESVAWVTEMKNTESGVFFLLTILCFLRWLRTEGSDVNRDAFGVLLFAVLAMLSKASTVILPAVLILCAWWMERQVRWRILYVIVPVTLMSILVSLISILAQSHEMASVTGLQLARSWPERIITAGTAVWFYLGKLVWPYQLSAIYPQWPADPGHLPAYLPAIAVVLVFVALWLWSKRGGRPYLFAFAYFLTALLPVVGLAENTLFYYSWVYDHLQYLASMGPLALAGAGVARIVDLAAKEKKWMPITVAVVWLLVLAVLSWQRAWIFTSSEVLWRDTLAKNPMAWVAHYNLGDALEAEGERDEALGEFQKAIDLKPPLPAMYAGVGGRFSEAQRWGQAIAAYRQALALSPNDGDVASGMGLALFQSGKIDEAITNFRRALQTKPNDDSIHANLGAALFAKGLIDEAISEYQRALALNPNVALTHDNLALALLQKMQTPEAIAEYQKTLELNPQFPDGRYDLGKAFMSAKQFDAAIGQFQAALASDPNSIKVHNSLGIAYALAGRPGDAVTEFERVVQLEPGNADAEKNLGLAKAAAAAKAKPAPGH